MEHTMSLYTQRNKAEDKSKLSVSENDLYRPKHNSTTIAVMLLVNNVEYFYNKNIIPYFL